MRVKTKDNKEKDVRIAEVSEDNYIVPLNERHLYHCRLEIPNYDAKTGKRLSVPFIQKFDKKFFETNGEQNLKMQGYTIEVLHRPQA